MTITQTAASGAAKEIVARWEEIDGEAQQQAQIEQDMDADTFTRERLIAEIIERHIREAVNRT